MGQIKEYQSNAEAVAPVSRGAQGVDTSNIGKGMANFGEAVGDLGFALVKRKEQQEIQDASVKLSEAHAQITNELADSVQRGDLNPDEFSHQVGERMQGISDELMTPGARNYFKTNSARLQGHFLESAMAGSRELAGAKARASYETSLNNSSSALLNDPSSFDIAAERHKTEIDSLVQSQGLPAHVAEQLKVEGKATLAKQAVRGWIKNNPEDAKKQLDEGKWDEHFSGDVKKQMYGEIAERETAIRVDKERQRQEQERLKDERNELLADKFVRQSVAGGLQATQIAESSLPSGLKRTIIDWNEQQNARPMKTSSNTYLSVLEQIHIDPNSPQAAFKITKEDQIRAYVGKGLTMNDYIELTEELNGGKTPEGKEMHALKNQFEESVKAKLVKKNWTGMQDAAGEENFLRWRTEFSNEVNKYKAAGKDPRVLWDPNAKEYFGNRTNDYVKSSRQIMKDNASADRAVRLRDQQKLAPKPGKVILVAPNGQRGMIDEKLADEYVKNKGYKRQ